LRPQRLAILAVLAAAGERGVTRERMSGLLWADADEERARHSLRQALYALRQELGADVIQSDVVLALDRGAMTSDVGDFRAALAADDRVRAASLANGAFLEGFYLPGAPGFERWVEEERAALTSDTRRLVLSLTKVAETAGDVDAAVEWWRRLTILDPLSGRFALGYLKALAGRGDRAGALAFARAHESVVRRELEADADPEIRRLEAELRAIPSPSVVRVAPAKPPERAVTGDTDATDVAPGAITPATSDSAGAPTAATTNELSRLRAPTSLARWSRTRRLTVVTGAAVGVLALTAWLTVGRWSSAFGFASNVRRPTFAVGMIREDGVPDTLRIGGVLTDMLATNLARVAGLSVMANSRLFELMSPGEDTLVSGYYEAARRAGATEILQGRLLAGAQWSLAMDIQRVDLSSGIVKGGYRVSANDRYALIDSMTAAIARDLDLGSPSSSVSDATTDSPIAYRLYEEGLRAYYQYDEAAARRLMQAALDEDSTFAMAAYYDARLTPEGGPEEVAARARALRLAARAPERERLMITADLRTLDMEPTVIAVADSLTANYPTDPRAFEGLSRSLWFRGDWRNAVTAIERAIALDSASEPADRQNCRLCRDFWHLSDIYMWWDSLAAAERTAQRYLRARPKSHNPWDILLRVAAARGDEPAARAYFRRVEELNPFGRAVAPLDVARLFALVEDYDEAERVLRPMLDSPRSDDAAQARWFLSIVLRNQGRIDEALRLARVRPGPNDLAEGLIALEKGDSRTAVSIFGSRTRTDESMWPPGIQARHFTWSKTLYGMALAAAGDTLALRYLADTVESWGARSLYGRDRRSHHYLRGMLLAAEHQDEAAAAELREAIHSPTNGFTRINYELARTLMRLGRFADALPVARAALHGGLDGSNLYLTRTDVHEVLAQAFDQLRNRDSAAVHYRAVVKAWEHADPLYHARRDRARAWLARNTSTPSSAASARRLSGAGANIVRPARMVMQRTTPTARREPARGRG
jgi:DNA-binding SARP family transcriptional activator